MASKILVSEVNVTVTSAEGVTTLKRMALGTSVELSDLTIFSNLLARPRKGAGVIDLKLYDKNNNLVTPTTADLSRKGQLGNENDPAEFPNEFSDITTLRIVAADTEAVLTDTDSAGGACYVREVSPTTYSTGSSLEISFSGSLPDNSFEQINVEGNEIAANVRTQLYVLSLQGKGGGHMSINIPFETVTI